MRPSKGNLCGLQVWLYRNVGIWPGSGVQGDSAGDQNHSSLRVWRESHCNKGYVQMAECGKVPLFKRVLAANPSDMALLTVKLAGFVKYLIYNAFCLY